MNAKPVIAILLGCLIMVITGHNIVPHHHHAGNGHSLPDCEQHNACKQSGDHAGESDEPGRHCHAFNGLEFVLNSEKLLVKKTITASSSIYLIALICNTEPLPREVNYDCAGGAPPDFEGFLGESAGLRAPPATS